jgi:uncharacterized alkaline shock family protein YloU
MAEDMKIDEQEHGHVKIADDVVGTIASIAAAEISGVNGLNGGIAGDLAEMFGKKNLSRGVKVNIEERTVFIDLNIIVDFGIKIPEVSWQIQESVKNAVESMTGLDVKEVNIHVTGVNLPKEPEKTLE